ncbi:MAG TPA: Uma2 family endonuclease [Bryobacteraceae bacterium]|nr:Uma2 family endonuclease [Bryobacteraceae bacterium]
MATAPTLPFVSVEEYLRTHYEPRCEYLDGVLKPKALPDYIHSKLQKLLLLFLAAQEQRLGIEGLPELHARITPTRWRLPDVCVLTQTPADGRYPDSQTPPLFSIEIVSEGEPWTDLRGKLADHLAMGIQTAIIADPYSKTVMVATQTQPLHEISAPLIVDIEVAGKGVLRIDFDDLYSRL